MTARLLAAAFCWSLCAAPASAQGIPVPTSLSKVPGDAALFAHVNVAELWDHPIPTLVRTLAGDTLDEPFGEFRKSLGIDPADLEAFTVFMPELLGPGDEQFVAFVFTTRKPYDREAILKVADGSEADERGIAVYDKSQENRQVLHFTSPTTFAVLHKDMADAYIAAGPGLADGPIHGALLMAASGVQTAVGSMNMAKTPRDMLLEMPPPEIRLYLPLFKAESIFAFAKLDERVAAGVRFNAEGNQAALDAEDSLKLLVRLIEQTLEDGKEELPGEGEDRAVLESALDTGLASLKTVEIVRDGAAVEARADLKIDPKLLPKLVQTIRSAPGAVVSSQSQNNLKQIALALHNYHDAHNGFPPAAIVADDGTPLLSWRVAILPYVEQDALYRRFKLDEPWDSEHNKPLSDTVVKVFLMPDSQEEDKSKTHYRAFVGNGAIFDKILPSRIQDITDGTSNTIMVVEAAEAVPWAKPDDLEYSPRESLPKLHAGKDGRANVAFADGSVRVIKTDLAERTMRLLIERADGNPIPDLDD